ncbi:tRNA 2-selenouridine(34) synthase MnmH [Porphyromonadaceae bacterium W3.11]|nr:tRNA 2-selenouridine(34) synthase MnmH [Porphyromonadaceae bacterium W3.11]
MNDIKRSKVLLLDVRTPSEYEEAHIPGALNLPLFTDEERANVGTTYKQVSREEAILLGLSYVGPRMSDMVRQTTQLMGQYQSDEVELYCARGGMRSASVAWLLGFYGLNVRVRPGGFKSYKALLPEFCSRIKNLVLLEGPTGSGKTIVLEALEQLGGQVIDLEGIAQHHGSAFGNIPGVAQQRSNEMIACLLIEKLSSFDLDRPIFLESESKKVGSREVPDPLFDLMKQAGRIRLETPIEIRIDLIVKQYGGLNQEYLLTAFDKIRRRLGHEACDKAKAAVVDGNLSEAVRIALGYYDKAYQKSGNKLWCDKMLGSIPYEGDALSSASQILKMFP